MPSKKLIADPKYEDLLTVRRIFKVEPLVCQILLATLSKTQWRSNPNFVIQICRFKFQSRNMHQAKAFLGRRLTASGYSLASDL